MTWWDTPDWHAYELAHGDQPGQRSRLLGQALWHTRIVDLAVGAPALWSGVRGSYHAIINRAHRDYKIDRVSSRLDVAVSFQMVHERAAGRSTRPGKTWDLMADMSEYGALEVYGASRNGGWHAFAGFYVYKGWAYYGHAAALVDDVAHALVWAAMQQLRDVRGVRYFEMGWQGEAEDAKGRNIEFFRRGFGGYDIPAKRAAKGEYGQVSNI